MKIKIFILFAAAMLSLGAFAKSKQETVAKDSVPVHYLRNPKSGDYDLLEKQEQQRNIIFVNEQITTHIIMPENIKLVDISTKNIAGNQCADNILRIKPQGKFMDNEICATITIVGERHMAQYVVVYKKGMSYAHSMYYVKQGQLAPYINPDVSMPHKEMVNYAWAIYGTKPKYFGIHNKNNGIHARVNNIYTIGDYFFIDYSLENLSNIKYEIEEIRVKLQDKREVKATNSQTIELTPVYSLNEAKSFKRGYRNVLVLNRLTFPDEKVLTIEISENQISGRVIFLNIDYSDILHADSFDETISKAQ